MNPLYDFYSHAPRGARQLRAHLSGYVPQISTHTPLAGRDLSIQPHYFALSISTHTPLAGRDFCRQPDTSNGDISTHTPLAGRDALNSCRVSRSICYFYSHAPRGARPLHLAHAATAPVTYWGGPDFSLKYRVHGDPFRAKNRIFSGEPPGISQLQHLRLTVFACILLVDIASVHPLVYVTPSCHAVILL